MYDDYFTGRELLKHRLRKEEHEKNLNQRHEDKLEELEARYDLDLKKQEKRLKEDWGKLERQLEHDKEMHDLKSKDKKEDIRLSHNLALRRQNQKLEYDKRQEELKDLRKNKELYLKSKVDYTTHAEQLEHNHTLSRQEHEQLLALKKQELENEVTLLNGKYQGDMTVIREELQKELTLHREQARAELTQVELQAQYQKGQAESLAQLGYKQALDVEGEITNRALELAKKQHQYELAKLYASHHLALGEKDQLLNHDLKRMGADKKAYQEKEDADLDRRFLEGREQLNIELVKLQAEMVRMTHENELQKDLETHRTKLSQQSNRIEQQTIDKYIQEIEDETIYKNKP